MRRTLITMLILLGPAVAAGRPAEEDPDMEKTAIVRLAGTNNAFALDLLRQVREEGRNTFCSPYSILSALAMAHDGAEGDTRTQMEAALRFPSDAAAVRLGIKSAGKEMVSAWSGKGCRVRAANALWGQEGFGFLEDFLKTVETGYGAELHQVDFISAHEAAGTTINRWVEKETEGLIKDLIRPGLLSPATRLVLTNAIWFKGSWQKQFDPKQTVEAPFFTSGRGEKKVPLMQRNDDLRYMEEKDFQVVELPYEGDVLSMVILLPRRETGLERFAGRLNGERLQGWLDALHTREVELALPRFKTTFRTDLARVLPAMGMKDAFSPERADFSGMTGRKDLFISNVVHQAFVEVDEEGTEAAAATGVVMKLTAVAEKKVFRADHPFLFLIRHRQSGLILFLGTMEDPGKN